MKTNPLCSLFGHKKPEKPTPVYNLSGICYYAFICPRCDKRTAATPEDAAKKLANEAKISAVMNADRVRLGLKPISWET